MDFEDIIWIAILLLGAFGGSMGKLVRKLSGSRAVDAPISTQETVFESEWDENQFSESAEEAQEAFSFEEEERQAGCFTYESVSEPNVDTKVETKMSEPNVRQVVDGFEEADGSEPFDLRKAIIYQAILQRVS